MSKKYLFEIPENPDSVVFYVGREITIDGKITVEVDRNSECARHLMSPRATAYCEKHWFNPVFMYSTGNLPVLIGFVFDEESYNSFSCVHRTIGAGYRQYAKCTPISTASHD
ncbi:MAG: hypothetical protein LUP99_05660 [Methanomicrobiales archaeon]|nr:hypothetical protein [Methanomicrobiales archaeon]